MSRAELKANTVNDPKFYIGILALLISAGSMVASVAVAYSRLNTKLDNLAGHGRQSGDVAGAYAGAAWHGGGN